jgi:hypothetical protein
MTFFARWLRIGFVAGATFGALGCAAILGNDYAVDDDAGLGSGLGGSRSSTSSTSTSSVSTTSSSGGSTSSSGGGSSGGGVGGDGAGGSGGDGGLGGSSAGLGGGTAGTIMAGGAAGASGGSGGSGGASGNAGASIGGNGGAFTDAANDVSPMDASMDTSTRSDAGSTIDAPPEASNCNPLNGACQGGVLTCNPGFSSCNATNADGCECATPSCCGLGCQNQHVTCMLAGNPSSPCSDGTGKYYYDCIALGTFNVTQATKACAAVTGNASACSMGSCPSQNLVIYGFDGSGNCVSWEYSGPAVGRMYKSNNASCFCPASTSPMWN